MAKLYTDGVPGGLRKRYHSEIAAWNAFKRALVKKKIGVIPHPDDVEISDSEAGSDDGSDDVDVDELDGDDD